MVHPRFQLFFTLQKQLSIFLILLPAIFTSCNKDIEEPVNPNPIPGSSQPDVFFITSVVGNENDLGLMINDPVSGKQFAASGPKNEQGKLDSIYFFIESEPETGKWLAHEISEDYTPVKTTTSTGHTLEYTAIDPVTETGTITVTETNSGHVVWEGNNLKFDHTFFENREQARQRGANIRKSKGASGAEMLYILSSMAGCGLGLASLGGGPLLGALGVYNTYNSCKSAKDALENLYSGKPAFGCLVTKDHLNTMSALGETLASGGSYGALATGLLPTLVNYGSQYAGAGDCGDDDNDDGNNGNSNGEDGQNGNGSNGGGLWEDLFGGGGKSWGDPHLSTPDGLLYDFHGYGEFIFTKSMQDNFEVQVRMGNPYSTTLQATLNTGLAIQTGTDVVCIVANPQKLYINNVAQELNFDIIPLKEGAGIKREIDKTYQVLTIRSKKGDLVKVRLDGGYYFDFEVTINESRKGHVQGLLGNYDGDKGNDLQLKSGERVEKSFSSMYPRFADSWRVEAANSLFYYAAGTNTETFTKKDFPKAPLHIPNDKLKWAENICLQAGITEEPFLTNCTCDVALTDDPAMAKSAVWEAQKQIENSLPPMDMSKIQLQGEAQVSGNFIRLTKYEFYRSGQAFYTTPLTGDFETEFTFRIPYNKNGSGDGLALLIAKDIPQLRSNSYPGKDGKLGYEGVPASLAVEFDTWADASSDESGNHIAIHTNGKEANSTSYTTRLVYNNKIVPLVDGYFHSVKVRYKNKTITVYLDGAQVLEKEVDLAEKLGLEGKCYVGITSSTSIACGIHSISGWSVKNL
ncbi:VWD domain-containing protein [Rhodocytophaga aerolata]|uniref:VWD domain-containing protein n=1 Tax=Rhodocytophaga aerolata TaxID=455078 RepID=A0ABT8R804_9BACT|nr:VWD domain-containing protein [Rhodocytophaga aerolata]MDO1448233.1 VWD domain-containing protein [Rhodocytophaga aerolata]